MRDLSGFKSLREQVHQFMSGEPARIPEEKTVFLNDLGQAMLASMVITFAQGFALLRKASENYQYGLDLKTVAEIWQGGCIIRAGLLKPIAAAFQDRPDLPNLLLDHYLGEELTLARLAALRRVVITATRSAIPTPGLMACLGYFDSLRSAWLPANLIQAQRDYFGAHTYERIDGQGVFHTIWEEEK
jgi:6-phosphogluconate dehydrogenase